MMPQRQPSSRLPLACKEPGAMTPIPPTPEASPVERKQAAWLGQLESPPLPRVSRHPRRASAAGRRRADIDPSCRCRLRRSAANPPRQAIRQVASPSPPGKSPASAGRSALPGIASGSPQINLRLFARRILAGRGEYIRPPDTVHRSHVPTHSACALGRRRRGADG